MNSLCLLRKHAESQTLSMELFLDHIFAHIGIGNIMNHYFMYTPSNLNTGMNVCAITSGYLYLILFMSNS